MVNRPYLLARLCWLSVAVGSLLFGPALLDCVAKPAVFLAAVAPPDTELPANSLRPNEEFGDIPPDAIAAGFYPNDLTTSVRTDVTPTTRGAVVDISGGSYSSPYTASVADRTIRLLGNVTYEGCGIRIAANNITVDLNGYTLTYNNVAPSDVETATVSSSGGGTGLDGGNPTLNPSGLTLSSFSHTYWVVEFTSGTESGNVYEVTTNNGTTLTLENHNNISDQPAEQNIWQDGGPSPGDTFRCYDPGKTFGVGVARGVYPGGTFEVVNGTIVHGAGYGRGCNVNYSAGINPIQYLDGGAQWTVGGVAVRWHGDDSNGINLLGSVGAVVKYCEIEDEGTVVTNRQRGTRAIVTNTGATVQYNHITKYRQAGIKTLGDSTVEYNEMYGESHATNSTGIGTFSNDDVIAQNNNIYSVGQHPVCIGIAQASNGCDVTGNWCEAKTTLESPEYGFNLSCGLAVRGGTATRTERNHYHDNAFITYSHDADYKGRTINLTELADGFDELIEDNFVGAYSDDETECHCTNMGNGCVTGQNNTMVSSHNIFWVSDGFDEPSGYSRWINNTVSQHGSDPDFYTFFVGQFWIEEVDFISNNFGTGTAVDDFDAGPTDAETILRFGWLLTVTVTDAGSPVSGATVTVKDKDGNILRDDYLTNGSGQVVVDVPTYKRVGPGFGVTTLAPITVEAVKTTKDGSNTISPTADDSITVTIE